MNAGSPESGIAIGLCWLAFVVVWVVSALRASRAKRVETIPSRLVHGGLLIVGCGLLNPWIYAWAANPVLIPGGFAREVAGVALTACGVGLAIWARTFLGRHWSGRVTLKEGHELIQSGPYRFVRHPIYSGIGAAILGTAIWEGRLLSLLAVGCILGAFAWKIHLEERWLTEEFGPKYQDYQRRVKALVPFVV